MDKYRGWFLTPAYAVDALPSYAPQPASNPFVTFRALPPDSRYRFLLDEAQFFIMNFIKGPVCRGQIAVDVIDDRFWVCVRRSALGCRSRASRDTGTRGGRSHACRRPTAAMRGIITPWLHFANEEKKYLQAKSRILQQALAAPGAVDLSAIWDGDGRNPNAALTVFRHFDNATVVKGLVGDAAEDVLGDRLPAVRAHLLPAGRGLRRLRQCRAPVEYPALHGLHAHGGRVQLSAVPAAGRAPAGGRLLVSRRAQRSAGICLRPQRLLQPRDRHRLPHAGPAARVL